MYIHKYDVVYVIVNDLVFNIMMSQELSWILIIEKNVQITYIANSEMEKVNKIHVCMYDIMGCPDQLLTSCHIVNSCDTMAHHQP